jgi:hypothetical protein
MSETPARRGNDGAAAYVIENLPAALQPYAREQWRHLSQGDVRRPDHRDFGLGDIEAQQIRLRLAGLV